MGRMLIYSVGKGDWALEITFVLRKWQGSPLLSYSLLLSLLGKKDLY